MVSVRTTEDGKHRTVSKKSEGYVLVCRNTAKTITFTRNYGGMVYCPLCSRKFGKWGKTKSK